MPIERTLIARAQELAADGPDHRVQATVALTAAILERYGDDPKRIAEEWATREAGSLKKARENSYKQPDNPTLFDVPSVIVITSDAGDVFIKRDQATVAEVRQWAREGLKWHTGQTKSFTRLVDRLAEAEIDDADNYMDAVRAITAGGEQ